MAKISRSTLDKTFKVFLRAIPIVPVPELLEVFKDFADSKDSMNRKIEEASISLKKSFELIEDLRKELKNKADSLEELKIKYQEYLKNTEDEELKKNVLSSSLLDKFLKRKMVDVGKLKTINNFRKSNNITRHQISELEKSDSLDFIEIDGVKFILLNDKFEEFKKKI